MLPLTCLLTLLLLQPTPATPTPPTQHPTQPSATASAPWADTLKGKWQGTIELPGGASAKLGYFLTISGPATATIAIPEQGLTETPLADVTIDTSSMKFRLNIPNTPALSCPVWDLQPAADGLTAKGTMQQSGMTLTTSIKHLADGDDGSPKRPQTPKPPFPFTTREVAYGSFDTAAINGTITIPEEAKFGKGPFPCALLITGSGMQDRDETLFNHKPFAVLADALARAGIATLRVDDRGFNGAKDPLGINATTDTFAKDVIAGLDFLATQSDIDPKRTGLIGHSEGGLIAPAVAAAKPGVAFIVLLAGPGVTGAEILQVQLAAIMKAQGGGGTTDDQIAKAVATQKTALAAVIAGDEAAVRKSMLDAVKENDPAGSLKGKPLDDAIDAGMKQIYSPWMRHFLTRDPRTDLRKVRCPVLILNGGKDVQVVAAQNVPEVTKALLDSGNANITARVFPNLNHLFQPVGDKGTGGVEEYAKIETTMDPAVLETITRWIAEIAK